MSTPDAGFFDPGVLANVAEFQLSILQTTISAQIVLGAIYGYFLSQVHTYFRTFPNDRLGFKVLVVALVVLNTGYAASFTVFLYQEVTRVIRQQAYSIIPSAAYISLEWFLWSGIATAELYFVFLCVKVTRSWLVRSVAIFLWLAEVSVWLTYIALLSKEHATNAPTDDETKDMLVIVGTWCLFGIAAWTSGVLAWDLIYRRDVKPAGDVLGKLARVFLGTSGLLAIIEFVGAMTSLFRHWATGYLISIAYEPVFMATAGCCVVYNLNERAIIRRSSAQTASLPLPTVREPPGIGQFKNASSGIGSGGVGLGSNILVSMVETREEEEYRPGEFVELGALRSGRWKQKEPLLRPPGDPGGAAIVEMGEENARGGRE
ncbi:hypothetical protein JCM10207_007526 [Rhodosporidiobolus poonsookiae]